MKRMPPKWFTGVSGAQATDGTQLTVWSAELVGDHGVVVQIAQADEVDPGREFRRRPLEYRAWLPGEAQWLPLRASDVLGLTAAAAALAAGDGGAFGRFTAYPVAEDLCSLTVSPGRRVLAVHPSAVGAVAAGLAHALVWPAQLEGTIAAARRITG